MTAEEFFLMLKQQGFDFFTGVPCSYLGSFCQVIDKLPDADHVRAVREDIAMGIASGAYLAGRWPVLYMQNAGLGYSLEVLASLNIIYRIPLLIIMTYRGPEDGHMEEHLVMGKHTEVLLTTFAIKHSVLDRSFNEEQLISIKKYLKTKQLPYCLLVPKGAWT